MGYITCYFAFKAIVRIKHNRGWLLMEKIVVIALSLFSWLGVLAFAFLLIAGFIFRIDFDKEAKW